MKKKILKYGVLFVFLLAGSGLRAQNEFVKFSTDSVLFLEEMSDFLKEYRKKDGKDLIKEFELVWFGGKLSEEVRSTVYSSCNFMLDAKLKPFPEFSNYLVSLIAFFERDFSEDSFEAWQESLKKLIDSDNKRKLSQYLEFCGDLFKENALYNSGACQWKVGDAKYMIEFVGEPMIIFPSLNLKCYSKGDSSVIYETSGAFYPSRNIWEGKGGKLYWDRCDFGRDSVGAELLNYEIKIQSPSFSADSVKFYNKFWFSDPLMGRIEEKVLANVTPENASYPRFFSYDKRFRISEIIPEVDYDGGFFQKGSKFIGNGDEFQDASFLFYHEGKLFIEVSAQSFVINPDRIASKDCLVKIFFDEDSITHPSLKMNFLTGPRKFSLIRTDEGLSRSPYLNGFHMMEMYFEQLKWQMGTPTFYLGPLEGSQQSDLVLESLNYFEESRFEKLMGIGDRHPLVSISACSRKKDNANVLSVSELSSFMRISESQVRSLVIRLSTMGFVQYNRIDDDISISPKLKHYILSSSNRSDYDVIQVLSKTTGGDLNGRINLLNFDMHLEGVGRVLFSDSQRVYIYPLGDKITIKKNRDMEFTGIVNAGAYEMFTQLSYFDYAKFKIDLPQVDSIRFYMDVGKKDERGVPTESLLQSKLEGLKGELLIDNPGNKSGFKALGRYPVFKSFENSYVFYDRYSIQKGVYDRGQFYFQIKPFEMDSIDQLNLRNFRFDGNFKSADIFPDFDEHLSVMSDLSLGFVRKTPEGGFPAYKGKGLYTNEINLSNRGLRGDGTLKYLNATIESSDFIFLPDSMNTIAENVEIEEVASGIEFPPVSGQEVKIHWEPYRDVLQFSSTEKPIAMYDNVAFSGMLTMQPTGVEGDGVAAFKKAEVESNRIKFGFQSFDADTSAFRLLGDENTESSLLSFATNNVRAHIDFKERKGEFVSNGGGSFVEFPQNEYIAFMDKFIWHMEDDNIDISASTKVLDQEQNVELEGSEFISVNSKQDSVRFYSPAARYDVKNRIIYCSEVKYVPIADALLYPDSEKVTIRKNAEIETFRNARIVANRITKNHEIYNATINIKTRHSYDASGTYDFVDENKQVQTFYFASITVDSTEQTFGKSDVTQEQGFTLSPVFSFYGTAKLFANNEFLRFDGFSKISHNCEKVDNSWFRFDGEIDPNDIYIPIDTVIRDVNKTPILAAITIKNDSGYVYPNFMSKPRKYSDVPLIKGHGFLNYDKTSGLFTIANLAKLNEKSLPGSFIQFDGNNCGMYSEGMMNFGVDLGSVTMSTYAMVDYYYNFDSTALKSMGYIDFFFANSALELMGKSIKKYDGLEGVPFDRPVYERGLQEILGAEKSDKLISNLNLYGEFKKFPDELNKSIVFNDLHFFWNNETTAWETIGRIGLGSVLKEQMNVYVNGNIQIVKKRSGDILTIYLELDEGTWYFFRYTRDMMQAISSDANFNSIIKEMKTDKTKFKWAKGRTYSYMLSTPRRKADFLKKITTEE